MSGTMTATAPNPQTAFILTHGRPVYETWKPNPDDCTPYDGVAYVGHRLGQAWAHQDLLGEAPIRMSATDATDAIPF
jgi:hypothetical protein